MSFRGLYFLKMSALFVALLKSWRPSFSRRVYFLYVYGVHPLQKCSYYLLCFCRPPSSTYSSFKIVLRKTPVP